MRSKQVNQPHQFFSSEPTTPFCQKQKSSKQNESHQFVDRTTTAVKPTMPLIYIYIYRYT